MRVPTYNRVEQTQAPELNVARMPGVVAGAFGADVAQAQEGLGAAGVKAGTQLLEHIEKQNYQRSLDIGDDYGNKLDSFTMDALYNKGTITKKQKVGDQDVDVEIPTGYLNRRNYAVDGSYFDLTQKLTEKRNADLEALKDNPVAQRKYIERFDTVSRTAQKAVLEHEANEIRNGSKDVLDSYKASQVSQYPMMSEEDKARSIASINARIDESYASGILTYAEAEKRKNDLKQDIFRTDINSNIAVAEEKLKSNAYDFDVEHLEKASQTLINYKAIYKKQQSAQQASDTISTLLSIASKKTPIVDAENMIADLNKISPELGEAAQKVVSSDFDFRPKKDDRAKAEMIHSIFDAGSIEDMASALVKNINSDTPMKSDELAIWLDVALKRGGGIQANDPKQKEVDWSFKALDQYIKQHNLPYETYLDFAVSMANMRPPAEALERAKRVGAEAVNPASKAYSVGQIVTNSRGESGEVISIGPRGIPMIKRSKSKNKANSNNVANRR